MNNRLQRVAFCHRLAVAALEALGLKELRAEKGGHQDEDQVGGQKEEEGGESQTLAPPLDLGPLRADHGGAADPPATLVRQLRTSAESWRPCVGPNNNIPGAACGS